MLISAFAINVVADAQLLLHELLNLRQRAVLKLHVPQTGIA